MIIYTASYPRCGNSLTRDIIHTHLQYPTSSVYKRTPRYPVNFAYATNWRARRRALGLHMLRKPGLLWGAGILAEPHIALYDQTVPPYAKDQRYLMRGCEAWLTPENRARLAAEDTVFFVKTHALPFAHYFPGETVLQPVRHPGPVFRSYQNLWRDRNDGQGYPLTFFIQGEAEFGSWSDYHQAWAQAAQSLGARYLRLRFESMLAERAAIAAQIATLSGLPLAESPDTSAFDGRSQANPRMYGFGGNTDWESAYTPDELALLESLHMPMMQRLGYAMPGAG